MKTIAGAIIMLAAPLYLRASSVEATSYLPLTRHMEEYQTICLCLAAAHFIVGLCVVCFGRDKPSS